MNQNIYKYVNSSFHICIRWRLNYAAKNQICQFCKLNLPYICKFYLSFIIVLEWIERLYKRCISNLHQLFSRLCGRHKLIDMKPNKTKNNNLALKLREPPTPTNTPTPNTLIDKNWGSWALPDRSPHGQKLSRTEALPDNRSPGQ